MKKSMLLHLGLAILFVALAGCERDLPDAIAPGQVTMTGATMNSTKIALTWTNPDDSDLSTVRVEWKAENSTAYSSISVAAAGGTAELPGPFSVGRYDIRLSSVDAEGNDSDPVVFSLNLIEAAPEFHFIYTAADLYAIRGGVSGYAGWGLSDGYCLMADLSLSGYAASEGWVPLGDGATTFFTGVFEGNGHTIRDLAINRAADYQGLFGFIESPGCVDGLTVQGSVVGNSTVGGLAGGSHGAISDCHAEVVVAATNATYWETGGLLGFNSGSITGSSASGAVTGGLENAGGLVGYQSSTGTITGSHATGAVTCTGYAGGLLGNNYGAVSLSYATGSATCTGSSVGGFVGVNNAPGTISECWSSGYATATSTSTGQYAGGCVGIVTGGSVSNCYSWGNAEARKSPDSYAGGFVGAISAGSVSCCYSLGAVTGSGSGVSAGGFTAWAITASSAANCYYCKERSGCTDTNGGSAPILTSAMFTAASYPGFDFSGSSSDGTADYWAFGALNYGYPYLVRNPQYGL